MCLFLGTILHCPGHPGASCNPGYRYCKWGDIVSKARVTFHPSCPEPQPKCPSQVQKCNLFCNILCCSAPGQWWFWYRTASTCLAGIFLDSQWYLKRKPSPEWELEKSFVPCQGLIPNGQAVPEAGGSKGAGEAGLELCQSSFPRDSQAQTDFWGPFLYCRRKQESWQHGLRRYRGFSAYFKKWAECSRVLAEFAELEKSGKIWEKGNFF